VTHPGYQHGLLVHDTDEELDDGVRTFVARGLGAGADVLVHGTEPSVARLRGVLDPHPRLSFGLDEELYQRPGRTLFAYQRSLAERAADPGARELWVTGSVPLGQDLAEQTAWHRYECAVDEALGDYPFVALCTYDARTRPDFVIAAALATHRTLNVRRADRSNPSYVAPAAFLATPLAAAPRAPRATPVAATVVRDREDVPTARNLVERVGRRDSAVSTTTIEQLRIAVSEVVSNGLLHGRPPVRVTLWAELGRLACLVEDSGRGLDPMAGYRHPGGAQFLGLWAARQLVDELVITDAPGGGCRVLLVMCEQPD
jgi:anti-sigma regulatory factor (Ser/Thr protein kinase)